MEVVRDIKEQLCYVRLSGEMPDDSAKHFKLSDDTWVSVTSECWAAPEIMFQPSLAGKDGSGVSQLLFGSIMKCDIDVRRTFSSNIVLAGGNTMFRGFEQRLKKDIEGMVGPG